MSDIHKLVASAISRIPAGHGIAVALSGGADSVALAAAVAEAVADEQSGRPLLLLHCNFHLRGEESDRDADIAHEIAERLSIPIKTVDFNNVRDIAAYNGESLEMTCRDLRYRWFNEVISSLPYTAWLALGHHCEDNRETILLNLFRGTGTRGLRGMDEFDPDRRFIRPLLRASRGDIEQFVANRQLPWIIDSSNLVPDVRRNKLRLNIIPAIVADLPDALRGLDTTASNLTDDYRILHQALNASIDMIRLKDPDTFDIAGLYEISASPRRVVLEITRKYGFSTGQAADINAAARSTEAKTFRSPTHTAIVHRGILSIRPTESHNDIAVEAGDPFSLAKLSGEFSCEKITTDKPLEIIKKMVSEKKPFYAMDATLPIPQRWTWRQPSRGDRIAPYGMKGRTRLVSDILTDAHASPIEKRQARLLVADDAPVWLAPWRASGFRPVTDSTTEILLFRLKS
ncbi:MAG: tRNA lysidine(34) synthetase TilS [Muribaculaceae bacterium]|nr:tRNA lysidine(34) synthetase TilS [Muribaculaceae bacterium]MDE6608964.1 tRNA lysidine(34) synthetase TilS [Muribaculaceae bacterium]